MNTGVIPGVLLLVVSGILLFPSSGAIAREEVGMKDTVEATFEITGWEENDLVKGDVRIYRTKVGKRFSGGIEGTSQAWLMMLVTQNDSRAYSGFELLEVRIGKRKGTFVLDHHASMDADGQRAEWRIMPGSGTGDLEGIRGSAEITRREDGSHAFTLHLE